MTVAAITAVLGGRKVLKRKAGFDTDLRVMTREGLPVKALPALAGEMSIELKALAKVVGISDRTLSRRLASDLRLTAEESDRTMRVARVFAKTKDTFGTAEKASRWLQSPNRALGGDVPLELLDTDAGAQSVQTILLRIDYGVYSQMNVWRICKERYAESALTGEGARLAGGRWNSVDVSMVYTSWCLSLAALEVFVNLDPSNQPRDLVWLAIEAPIEEQWNCRGEKDFLSSLPPHWREHDDPETQRFGDEWIRSGRSAGLVVPSVLIEGEWNVLLNPAHIEAKNIRVVEKRPFRFDDRMLRE